jgi:exonuclease VII small subunit
MAKKNLSYSEAITTIDEILQQIETGELDVDEGETSLGIAEIMQGQTVQHRKRG